ncbi:MAG: flippase [Methyloprofundus sp.]|nr:flippase [Methyloprofundus sp.]
MINKLHKFYKRIQIYLANTSWIMGEKIVVMGLGFLVTVILARYLGPEQFGILSYAISLVALFGVAGHVGLSGLVIRELVKEPENKQVIMGTSFALKGAGYLIGLILVLLVAFLTEPMNSVEFWVLVIVAFSLVFKPFDVIDFWFQSRLEAKYTAISRTLATVVSSAFQLVLVFVSANLVMLAAAHLVQATLTVLLLVSFFFIKSKLNIKSWQFSKNKAKELFSQGWVVFLGSIFAVIYLKIDQVMLKWLVGAEEVGIYAVAATLSEAWYFVPVAIVASFFPKLIKLKEHDPTLFHHRLQQLFDFLFILALGVAIVVAFLAQPIITIFFGESYIGAASILVVHIWSAVFVFLRAGFRNWMFIENMLMFSLITHGIGALVNVALNFWLIPQFGGLGAAYATLLAYATASYIALLFHSKTRVVFIMMTKSIFSPVRYLLFIKGN